MNNISYKAKHFNNIFEVIQIFIDRFYLYLIHDRQFKTNSNRYYFRKISDVNYMKNLIPNWLCISTRCY